jgi:hypothetical protein
MDAATFHTWVKRARLALEDGHEPPEHLIRKLIERLEDERLTFDSSVLDVVHAWRGFESGRNRKQEPAIYARTIQLIDMLLPYAEPRPHLHASLATIKGDLLLEMGKLPLAAEAFAAAVDDLHGLHLDIDTQRIYGMVRLGFILLAQARKQDAEKIFLDVLSYPWYLVMETEAQRLLREYYIDAGEGLIEARRGNPEALKEIYFVPAVYDKLLPKLQAAIEEANGL